MFKNPTTILITVGVLVAIAIGLQFIDDQENTAPEAIRVVPDDAAMVIETGNFVSLLRNINKNNQFKLEFEELEKWKVFFEEADALDSLISGKKVLREILQNNRVIVSGHIAANNQLAYLYAISVKEKYHDAIKNTINTLGDGQPNIRQRKYENQILNDITYYGQNNSSGTFTYTIAQDVFIFSFSQILVEEAVRILNSGISLATNKNFVSVSKTAGKNADVNIYFNYKYFPLVFKNLLDDQNNDFYDFFRGFAAWTELDLIYKNDAFLMSGFTQINDSLNQYLRVLEGQTALHNDFLTNLPGNTSAFIAFNLSNPATWKNNYYEFMQKRGDFEKKKQYFEKALGKHKVDFRDLFYNGIENAVCMAWLNKNLIKGDQEKIGIFQMKDIETASSVLKNLSPDSIPPQKVGGHIVRPFPERHIFSKLFGDVFSSLKSNYYTTNNGNLIFAESIEAISLYLRKSKAGSKLTDNKYFMDFSNSLSSESNIYAYLNFAASKDILRASLNSEYRNLYNDNTEKFDKIQAVAIQYGLSGNKVFTNFYGNFNPKFRKTTRNIWEVPLDQGISMKPTIVKNHNTRNNEVIFQDEAKQLVLVSNDGKVLWKKNIDGKILSDIHQIDKYKNNKIQYLFNTQKALYLVDRNGKDVEGFPIQFKSPATNGIAVFDYNNKRDYRIAVACENKHVYLLTADGGKIEGWTFGQTKGTVRLPLQHFVNEGKDYIIFADEQNTYIVNRRGETRIEVKSGFAKSRFAPFFFEKGETNNNSRFVTTASNGNVYFIFLDGVVKKMSLGNFSPSHRFEYSDLEGDGLQLFIFSDKNKLSVFNRNKSKRFEIKFEASLKNSLNLYQFGDGLKFLGVSPEGLNKIYLIHPSGKVVKGFPMHGNGAFSITKMNYEDNTSDLNLITANTDNFLFNYRLATK